MKMRYWYENAVGMKMRKKEAENSKVREK